MNPNSAHHPHVRDIRPSAWSLIRLRRDGLPPLRFRGRLIARHDGAVRRASLWHDLALYRTPEACFVVEIVAQCVVDQPRPGCQVRPARCHAALFETLDAALSRMETHDPTQDICPGTALPEFRPDDPAISTVSLMMQAAVLRGLCGDVARRYRIGVGVLLAGIGLMEV